MDSTNVQLLNAVNEIAGALDAGECRSMLYLCGRLDLNSNREALQELLRSGIIRGQMNDLFLVELLFEVKRFDILWKVFQTRAHEIETALGNKHALSKYRVLMVNINEDLTNGDIKNLIFLLSSTVQREKMDKIKYFLDVVVELENMDKLSPGRLDFIEKCLKNIDRIDLAKKVCSYKQSDGAHQTQSFPHPGNQQKSTATHCPTQTYSQQPKHRQPSKTDKRFGNSVYLSITVPQISAVPESRISQESLELEEYSLQAEQRGLCLIIDCVGTDGERMEEAFRALHFRVRLHKWLSVDDTASVLRKASRRAGEHRGADAFVCCIISRGTASGLLATDAAHSSRGLRLDTVRHLFVGDVCPALAGKPKLFFIQRYSVSGAHPSSTAPHRDSDLQTDGGLETDGGARGQLLPTDADIFWSHCWTSEHQLEQGDHRSVYLQALTDGLLRGQRRKLNVVDVHTELNGLIYDHNKRNPAARYTIDLNHTLRRHLFLT